MKVKAGYLVTYPTGDTAFFESLPESLPKGIMIQEQMHEFQVMDRVEKHTGDYKLEGVVVGFAVTLKGAVRYIVEHHPLAPGMLHIYSAANLRKI